MVVSQKTSVGIQNILERLVMLSACFCSPSDVFMSPFEDVAWNAIEMTSPWVLLLRSALTGCASIMRRRASMSGGTVTKPNLYDINVPSATCNYTEVQSAWFSRFRAHIIAKIRLSTLTVWMNFVPNAEVWRMDWVITVLSSHIRP